MQRPSTDGTDGREGIMEGGRLFYVVAASLLGIFMLNEILLCQERQVTVNGGEPQFCQLNNYLALYSGILPNDIVCCPDSRANTL